MLLWTLLLLPAIFVFACSQFNDDSNGAARISKRSATDNCYTSPKSGRHICHISKTDTSCYTSPSNRVPWPQVEHSVAQMMYGVKQCDCFEHSVQRPWFANETVLSSVFKFQKAYYFLQYECEFGYEFFDEAKMLFCSNGTWKPDVLPKCIAKGACKIDNGGCSHSCVSNGRGILCRCPEGMKLGPNRKNCETVANDRRAEKQCSCRIVDSLGTQSCDCPQDQKPIGPPSVTIFPNPPYEIMPGENITLICRSKSFLKSAVGWKSENCRMKNETLSLSMSERLDEKTVSIVTKFSEISASTVIACNGKTEGGEATREAEVLVAEPGSAPQVSYTLVTRTKAFIWWEAPIVLYCPIKVGMIYYTTDQRLRLEKWEKTPVDVFIPVFILRNLRPNTKYFYRLRALSDFRSGNFGPLLSFETSAPDLHEPIIVRDQITRTSIKITWEPPPLYQNRAVKDYTLYYGTDIHLPLYMQSKETVQGTENEIVIKDLTPSTQYYLLLRARYYEFQYLPQSLGVYAHYRTL